MYLPKLIELLASGKGFQIKREDRNTKELAFYIEDKLPFYSEEPLVTVLLNNFADKEAESRHGHLDIESKKLSLDDVNLLEQILRSSSDFIFRILPRKEMRYEIQLTRTTWSDQANKSFEKVPSSISGKGYDFGKIFNMVINQCRAQAA
jgi:hypothetical protein